MRPPDPFPCLVPVERHASTVPGAVASSPRNRHSEGTSAFHAKSQNKSVPRATKIAPTCVDPPSTARTAMSHVTSRGGGPGVCPTLSALAGLELDRWLESDLPLLLVEDPAEERVQRARLLVVDVAPPRPGGVEVELLVLDRGDLDLL